MSSTIDDIPNRVSRLESSFSKLENHVVRLDKDISEIRVILGQTATKTDVANLGAKIDQAVSGVLRDAINAVPGRHIAIWTTVMAIATIGLVLLAAAGMH